jgi:phospholipid/cholesterol/gamma-HCH transport system substrate-binding protein
MNKKPIETIMGLVVIAVAVLFFQFAYSTSNLQIVEGYKITANFLKVGGLSSGSDVRINGIKVGTVLDQKLDTDQYVAKVTMSIANDISLPKDTQAVVTGDGLMGDKYIKLIPGSLKEKLKDGDILAKTKDYKSLEEAVGEIIFLVTDGEDK